MGEFKTNITEITKTLYKYAKSGNPATKDKLLEYYKAGKENPSLASMILHDTFNKKKNFVKKIKVVKNIALADQDESVKSVLHEFAIAYKKIYNRTSVLRQYLIQQNRISMDYVKPKASKLFKFKIGLFKYL